jgi:hypothetical protein
VAKQANKYMQLVQSGETEKDRDRELGGFQRIIPN